MDIRVRNKKVAIARWKNKFKEEKLKIKKDKLSLIKKAALCGFLAGDGCVQIYKEKNFYHHRLDFYADDQFMSDIYNKYVYEIYGAIPKVIRRDNMNESRISKRYIVLDIMKECNFGLKKWSFPDELFKIKGTKEAWLRAFYSAEGYVNKRYIKNQSINLKSMKKVSSLLKEFGIDNNYYEYLPINKNWSKVAMIFISSKKARISFYEKIGFWHKRKSEKLKESLDL